MSSFLSFLIRHEKVFDLAFLGSVGWLGYLAMYGSPALVWSIVNLWFLVMTMVMVITIKVTKALRRRWYMKFLAHVREMQKINDTFR